MEIIEGKKAAAVISNGCRIKGNMEISGPLYVNGLVRGHIISTDSVFIGSSGSVTGDIKAKHVMVNGLCAGSIFTEDMEILDSGNILGPVYAKSCSISKGGCLNGTVKIGFDYRESLQKME